MLAIVLAALLASAVDPDDFPSMSLDQDPKPAAPEAAKAPALPWRTFELCTGVSFNSVQSSILATRSSGGAALAVDAEGVLGMSREVLSGYIWTAYRLGDRHRIQFSFEDLTRTATRSLQRDIDINGNIYSVGTTVHSVYGVQFFNLSYVWSFLQDDRMELGLSVGFDTIRSHFSIEDPTRFETERFTIPLPLPGFNADFVLVPDLWLRQRIQFMYVPIQDYSGLLIDFSMSLEYSVIRNVSIGLGLDLFRLELEKRNSGDALGSFEGKFEFHSSGLMLYINFHL